MAKRRSGRRARKTPIDEPGNTQADLDALAAMRSAAHILDIARLDALAILDEVWLHPNGVDFAGALVPSSEDEPWPDGVAVGVQPADPAMMIVGFDLDQLGTWRITTDPCPEPPTADAAGAEIEAVRGPPGGLILTPIVTPSRLLRMRREAMDSLSTAGMSAKDEMRRAHRARRLVERSLYAEIGPLIDAWKMRDPHRLGTRRDRVADASLFADGMLHDGGIRQVAGRPHAVLPADPEHPQDRRLVPLFTPFEIGVVRRAYGIDERIASSHRILWVQRILERRAAAERLRHDRPALVEFLENYHGDSEFLCRMRDLVGNGAPLTSAQLEAVERAHAGILHKALAAGGALRRTRPDRKPKPPRPERLDWIRREAEVIDCTRMERPDPFRPGTTIVRHRVLLRADDGAMMLARTTAFHAEPGERVRLMAALEGIETDPRTGTEMTLINRLFPLDEDGRVIRRSRPRRVGRAVGRSHADGSVPPTRASRRTRSAVAGR